MHAPSPVLRSFFPKCLALGLILALSAPGADGPDDLKAQTERWIQLEKTIADERNEWRAQKEALEASVQVLQAEQTTLQSQLEANDLAAGLFRTRVEKARAELAGQETGHTALAASCDILGRRLGALFVRLPDPLREKVQPFLDKLEKPSGSASLTISERAQTLVSALTAIDLFNNSLTLTHHLKKNGTGETLDVKVLYWGLAAGYGIDAQGKQAWLLTPGETGWDWKEASAHVPEIRALIAVYEKQQNPQLVALPIGGAL